MYKKKLNCALLSTTEYFVRCKKENPQIKVKFKLYNWMLWLIGRLLNYNATHALM